MTRVGNKMIWIWMVKAMNNLASMNQMNQMNLFGGVWCIKNIFLVVGGQFCLFCLHLGSFIQFLVSFGLFLLSFISFECIKCIWMYLYVFLSVFSALGKRIFFCDEPLEVTNLHVGSFGSLRIEVAYE